MDDRFERLERATSYLESFLDVLKRCEVLAKEEQAQYDGYLEYLIWMLEIYRNSRLETKKKQDQSQLRDEKIYRMRVEKECENRLKEIAMMEVSDFTLLEKWCFVGEKGERSCCRWRSGAREVASSPSKLLTKGLERFAVHFPRNGDFGVYEENARSRKGFASRGSVCEYV